MGCLCILFIIVVAFGMLLFAVYDNSSHPKLPYFGVESASLNSLTMNGSRLSGEWNINLTFTNPNNGWNEASYNTICVSILYNNEHNPSLLASTQLAPFSKKDDATVLKQVQFKMDLHDAEIERSFSCGAVNFEIEMSTSVRFTGAFDFRKDYSLKVLCNPLTIKLSPGSSKWALAQGLTCQTTTTSG
ncbi:hypothetical protein MtrunA17_Chr3g0134311 [Medicago truncatula]|nr:hypothetical protein MtrunA17_Chr3g0134311 [Medicago truncatula]